MQRIARRAIGALLIGSGMLLGAASVAQEWPSRPVTFVVPSAAGGSPDVLSRTVMNQLSKDLGASFVVENKPGAAGSIGIVQIKRAQPDGYTIGYGNINTLAVNRALFNNLTYDVDADLQPVIHFFSIYNVLIVPADSPLKSVADLLRRAKEAPGKMSYGAPGIGTTGHMGGELFKSLGGIKVEFIPYNSGPAAIQDLLGGRLDYMFSNSSESIPLIKSGKVRALGVSSMKRLPSLPDVPTVDEAGLKGYETIAWGGVVAPKGTPAAVVDKLNMAVQKALQAPNVIESLATLGAEPGGGSAADFKALIDRETVKWKGIIETAGIKKLD
ncbi:tripartite tricarboxylate transporter substrate binding protein [Alcaligenaceae bacterium]|nr:tripartite tricarboxylate transporter substrate binding protein [Alcaligenaceae bacterium]